MLGLFNLIWKLFVSIMEPEAVSKLVAYFENSKKMTFHDAVYYAGILVAIKFLHCFYFQNYMVYLSQLAIQIRSSFCSLIYRKALKLSPAAQTETSLGQVVTVMTKDVSQFEHAIWLFNDLWIAVVQTIVVCNLIYSRIGWSSMLGVSILLATVPVQAFMSKWLKKLRIKINKKTDERLQATQEALSTIKIIKMYTWEKVFEDGISHTRSKEMRSMLKTFYSKMMMMVSSSLVAKLGFYALMMLYIHLTVNASAQTIFYVMRCFDTLRYSLAVSLSWGFARMAELGASLTRINNILNAEELQDMHHVDKPDDDPQIELRNISVSIKDKEILHNLDTKMNVGLNIVTGQLGSGKSSMIKTILKEYPISSGELRIRGRKSYASQDPWLFPSSIRQNILFGEKYDQERYMQVIKVCALEYDFKILDKGDETIVADRGLNLSKGQQARINLARAVYKDSDIYLIDDALTALDPKVQEQIFSECILGFLKGKLVVLVTHNAKHITSAEKVIVLKDGAITFDGKHQELTRDILEAIEDEEIHGDETITKDEEVENLDEKSKLLATPLKRVHVYHEVKKQGGVGWDIYKQYFRFGGGICFVSFIVLLYFGATFAESASAKMLTNWINAQDKLTGVRRNYTLVSNMTQESPDQLALTLGKMGINVSIATYLNESMEKIDRLEIQSAKSINFYTILLVSGTLCELIKYYMIFKFALNASFNLHKAMIHSIVNAIMSFFDTYFIGNILNRFSQDLAVIDEHFPFVLTHFITTLFHVAGMIGLIASVNWKFVIPSIILIICLVIMRFLYIPTSRSLKRLEAATRSPMVGHLNSSIEGITTIRAYKAQDILCDEFDRHQDLYTSANYTSLVTKRAFGFYMDFFAAGFITLIIGRFLIFDMDTAAGDVGLTISKATSLAMIIQMALMQWAEIENLMTSVERVLEYTKLEVENKSGLEIDNWPNKGEITYVNVNLNYAKTKERVLKNISFSVKSKQKIGIVGRTGAGKSSIIATLFRLYNFEGQIYIDDVETKTLALKFLRQHISIIPQDPIMFSGTIRANIDPLGEFTDEEIWKTLHKVHLDAYIPELECRMEDTNFSTGQRQLICLARAIIRKNRIVVLDEATANMDPETEFLIQKTIVENFSSATVFIIAHRLQSILDCHKVMVMDKGEIIEFEDPLVLMEDKNSVFTQMLKNAGLDVTKTSDEKKEAN
ncbi:unnamed protein product [Acanthoscelides obtectus]|nr:unnamed protein product [Acanthoscelides obtectus]CAK1667154.1 Multidrug resistance-associated protein 4 [Acanthoscelides obtectus]